MRSPESPSTPREHSAPLLTLHDIARRYGAAADGFLLRIPYLRIDAGECVTVVGPSGSGKSTLLDLLALLAAPEPHGRFIFHVEPTTHDIQHAWDTRPARLTALRARHIGYVLQTGGLLPYLNVRENILLARRLLRQEIPGPLPYLAAALGIASLLRRRPDEISVGQRQRVAIARALAHEPALVLADEPTAALDASSALIAVDTLVAGARAVGAALVVVTHDQAIAARIDGRTMACRPDSHDAAATLET